MAGGGVSKCISREERQGWVFMDTLLSLATEELGSVQSSLHLNEERTWTWDENM